MQNDHQDPSQELHDLTDPVIVFAHRYQAFFDSTTDGIAVFSPSGDVLDANPQLIKLAGFAYDQMVTKNLRHLFDESSAEEIKKRFHILFQGQKRKFPLECNMKTGGGKERPVEMSLSLLRHQFGFPKTILAIIRDITARKEAENRLFHRAEELQRVFDAVPTMLFVIDSKERIQKVNKAGLDEVGKSEDEILKKTIGQALECEGFNQGSGISPACGTCIIHESLTRSLKHGETIRNYEASFQRRDGQTCYYRVNAVPMNTQHGRWAVFSVEDITHRKEAEKETAQLNTSIARANMELKRTLEDLARSKSQLMESQKLEQIGLLASGLAHNLKTPISGIKGYAQLMKMDYPQSQELSMIIEEVEVVESIINDLMIKTRKDHENREELINLNELLKIELNFLAANMFYKHAVNKEIELDDQLPMISGIYSHFSQIIMNIVQNALDAMFEAENKVLTVKTYHDESDVFVEIIDTGKGIPQDIQELVFDVFFTTKPSSIDRKGEEPIGTGLGLSNASYFIRQYGGNIELKSQVGQGTRVIIRIPYRLNLDESIANRVLIVDDSDSLVDILTRVCREMGLETFGATNGLDALDLVNKVNPHLIISDLMLPGLSGKELMDRVRQDNPKQKVIYITGYSDNPEFNNWLFEETKQPSLNAVLKKPFPLDSFRKVLQRMLY